MQSSCRDWRRSAASRGSRCSRRRIPTAPASRPQVARSISPINRRLRSSWSRCPNLSGIPREDQMTSHDATEEDGLAGKACFDDIYTGADPRAYYAALRPLEYQIPHHAQQVVRSLLRQRSGPERIVDLCCSYGVNAALFAHDLTLDDLYKHYATDVATDSLAELIAHDRAYFASHRLADGPVVVGLDQSAPAIAYACAVGQLDAGFAEDLETAEPSDMLREAVEDTTMITVSGGVGYITHRTFERVVSARSEEHTSELQS